MDVPRRKRVRVLLGFHVLECRHELRVLEAADDDAEIAGTVRGVPTLVVEAREPEVVVEPREAKSVSEPPARERAHRETPLRALVLVRIRLRVAFAVVDASLDVDVLADGREVAA